MTDRDPESSSGNSTALLPETDQETIRAGLDGLEKAIEGHVAWLNRWHRAIICALPADPDDMTSDAHRRCAFGRWYRGVGGRELGTISFFDEVGAAHRALHVTALGLLEWAGSGETIRTVDYDRFMHQVLEFNQLVHRLQHAAWGGLLDSDPLTGLPNRRGMTARLSEEVARFERTGQVGCVALADLDHFKRVNDTYGHTAGDKVLAATAALFSRRLRPYDSVFRYGGEEFLICLPGTSRDEAHRVLNRLRRGLAETSIPIAPETPITVTASFGIALMEPGITPTELTNRADQALYQAKRTGRNRVCTWNGDLPESA